MPDFVSVLNDMQHALSQLSLAWLGPVPALLTALFAGLTVRSLASRISLAPAPQRALAEYLAQPNDDSNPQRIAWHDKEAVILFSLGLSNQPGMLAWIRVGAVLVPFLLFFPDGFAGALALALSAVLAEPQRTKPLVVVESPDTSVDHDHLVAGIWPVDNSDRLPVIIMDCCNSLHFTVSVCSLPIPKLLCVLRAAPRALRCLARPCRAQPSHSAFHALPCRA